jgi:hypothetical protein
MASASGLIAFLFFYCPQRFQDYFLSVSDASNACDVHAFMGAIAKHLWYANRENLVYLELTVK